MSMSPGPVGHLHRVGGARPSGVLDMERLGLERGDPRALPGSPQPWEGACWYGGGLTLAKTIRGRAGNRGVARGVEPV